MANASIPSASSPGAASGTTSAASRTVSGTAPRPTAMIGTPWAMASISGTPKPSWWLGETNRSASA